MFVENTAGAVTIGLDWIPFEAEFDSRSTTQSTIGAKGDGAASSGTNKGTVDVSNHLTLYVQPAKDLGNGLSVFERLVILSRCRYDSSISIFTE